MPPARARRAGRRRRSLDSTLARFRTCALGTSSGWRRFSPNRARIRRTERAPELPAVPRAHVRALSVAQPHLPRAGRFTPQRKDFGAACATVPKPSSRRPARTSKPHGRSENVSLTKISHLLIAHPLRSWNGSASRALSRSIATSRFFGADPTSGTRSKFCDEGSLLDHVPSCTWQSARPHRFAEWP